MFPSLHRLSKCRSLEARQDSHRWLVYPNSRTGEVIKPTVRRIHIEYSTLRERVTMRPPHTGLAVYPPASGRHRFDPTACSALTGPANPQPVTQVKHRLKQL